MRITFQPREAVPNDDADDVLGRGVVVLDPVSWRARRVEYRYLHDGSEIGGGSVSFADRVIEGSPVAFMARATGSFRIPGVLARLNGRQAQWTFTFRAPRDVVRVP